MIIYDIDGTNSGTVLRNVCFEMIYFLNVQAFVNTAAFGAGIMLYKKNITRRVIRIGISISIKLDKI